MTTDTRPPPTDNEIAALRSEFGITSNGRGIREFTQVRDFARAVLAKWGTPAGAGEVVACGNCGGTGWMVRDPDIGTDQECFVCDGSGGYSESAPPQPVACEPLTDEQIRAMCKEPWIFDTAKQWVRLIEAAHGIKGGRGRLEGKP